MTDFQIVRQQSVAFGAAGFQAASDEVFIKVLVSFQDRLVQLKNARLHVFIAIALQEAKIILGCGSPLSLRDLEKIVPYSRPVIAPALDYLTEYRFLIELDERGPEGEKQYRVCSYAWFGTRDGASASHPEVAADVPADPSTVIPSAGKRGKEFLPPPTRSASVRSLPPSPSGCKESLHAEKIFSHDHDHDDDKSTCIHQSNSHHHDHAAARKILFDGGFRGKRLDELATRLDESAARVCVEWIALAKQIPAQYREPYGYAYAVITRGAIDDLPPIELPDAMPEIPPASAFGMDRAGQVWRDVVCALPLSNRALMLNLIGTRVVDWEDDGENLRIVVLDESGYVVNRLRQNIENQLNVLTERNIELDCVTARGDDRR